MSDTSVFKQKELSNGETAIDGLFGGVLSGIVMVLILILTGLTVGDRPGTVLARFSPGGAPSPLVGLIAHLAVSGIYGLMFGTVYQFVTRRWIRSHPAWAAVWIGGLYGLALLLLARVVFLSTDGSALKAFPSFHFSLAHLTFGLVLGFFTNYFGKKVIK
jgi:hypothetical protein